MLIHPTKEQVELREKLAKCTDDAERKIITEKLRELAVERDNQLKDCPFEH